MTVSEWVGRISAVERYLDSQYALMSAITQEMASELIEKYLDTVRICRIAFAAFPPDMRHNAGNASAENIQDSITFLEKSLKARQNEQLILEWLKTAPFNELTVHFERKCLLSVDPVNDFLILGSRRVDEVYEALQKRGYQRLIRITDVLSDPNDLTTLDDLKVTDVVSKLPDIKNVRPERLHFVDPDGTNSKLILETFESRTKLFYVSRNTTSMMAGIWTTQILKNLPKVTLEGQSLLDLRGAGSGRTAVVVGAGPSLDQVMPEIKRVADQAIIIVAFKALRSLIAAGVRPHFVLCLDPKQKKRHLEGVDFSQVGAFVYEAASNDEMVASVTGCPTFPFVASDLPIEILRALKLAAIPIMGTAGSAVHGALQLSVLLGCPQVYLAGTDFGFPDNRLYATGSGTGDEFKVSADGKSYSRQPLDSHFRSGNLKSVPANDGGEVGASLEMIQFREWVEKFVGIETAKNSQLQFFNLAFRGAVIKDVPFAKSIECSHLNDESSFPVREVSSKAKRVSDKKKNQLVSVFLSRVETLRKLRDSCQKIKDKNHKNRDFSVELNKMQSLSRRCIEVSTLINEKLMEIDEYADRVSDRSREESDRLILDLVSKANKAAEEISDVYLGVVKSLKAG